MGFSNPGRTGWFICEMAFSGTFFCNGFHLILIQGCSRYGVGENEFGAGNFFLLALINRIIKLPTVVWYAYWRYFYMHCLGHGSLFLKRFGGEISTYWFWNKWDLSLSFCCVLNSTIDSSLEMIGFSWQEVNMIE